MTLDVRKRALGYSVVEVMMAMALLGLGAVGVLASLKSVAIGGAGVRDFDAATSIAQGWVDRVAADATAWVSTTTFGGAGLLASGASGNAFLPAQAYGSTTLRAGADLHGNDVDPAAANRKFCTALGYRCTAGGAPGPACASIVVGAAVFWPREGTAGAPAQFCTATIAAGALPMDGSDRAQAFDDVYRTVTISSVVTPSLP